MSETNNYKEEFFKSAAILSRNQLGSIDVFGDKKELKEGEQKDRNAKIANDYKLLERIIEDLIKDQTEFMVKDCKDEYQFLFGRGTINGLSLVLETFQKYRNQNLEDTKPKDKDFNKFDVV